MTAASSSTSDGLRVENLRVERGGQTVVHSLSLQVAPGQLVGLLGPNGAGKSTAFHAIIGLVQSRSGTIHLNGQPLERLSMFRRARAGLGYMPQEAAVFEGLTVRQNLDAVMEVGLPRRQRRLRLAQHRLRLRAARALGRRLHRGVDVPSLAHARAQSVGVHADVV